MLNESSALELVGQVYDAALDPSLWSKLLGSLSGTLNAPGSILLVQDVRSGRLLMSSSAGLDPDRVQEYNDYYVTVDPRVPQLLRTPPGTFGTEASFVSDYVWKRSELVNDFLSPIDFYYALNGVILKDNSTISILSRNGPGMVSSILAVAMNMTLDKSNSMSI